MRVFLVVLALVALHELWFVFFDHASAHDGGASPSAATGSLSCADGFQCPPCASNCNFASLLHCIVDEFPLPNASLSSGQGAMTSGNRQAQGPSLPVVIVREPGAHRGTRVQRNPEDWSWGDFDGASQGQAWGRGTIQGNAHNMPGWVVVAWDVGRVGQYRVGYKHKWDLTYAQEAEPAHEPSFLKVDCDRSPAPNVCSDHGSNPVELEMCVIASFGTLGQRYPFTKFYDRFATSGGDKTLIDLANLQEGALFVEVGGALFFVQLWRVLL
jgi:hypothetical protein